MIERLTTENKPQWLEATHENSVIIANTIIRHAGLERALFSRLLLVALSITFVLYILAPERWMFRDGNPREFGWSEGCTLVHW